MVFSQAIGYVKPDREALLAEYVGKKISELPTPSCILDRTKVKRNCDSMLATSASLGMPFRAHIKTHKTLEGVRLQLGSAGGDGRLVVSTVMEAYSVLPLVEEGLVKDVLYGLPVVKSRIPELCELAKHIPSLRLMLDSEDQLASLLEYSQSNLTTKKWSLFIKVDCGTARAGLPQGSKSLHSLITRALSSEMRNVVEVYGFYCHAGHSYSTKTPEQAKAVLVEELTAADSACRFAQSILPAGEMHKFIISVGATPTAHAAARLTSSELAALNLAGLPELHAGCYPFCDLQQYATGLVPYEDISIRVLSEVVSHYPDRAEMLINAGTCALSREAGPIPGYGNVEVTAGEDAGWFLARTSQEHGILQQREGGTSSMETMGVGTKILVVPQHACITGACYQWYYVVDELSLDASIVDIWVRFNGW